MKKILFCNLLLSLCLNAHAEIASGVCDYDITWSLSDDYVLTLSGEGELYDFDCEWDSEKNANVYMVPWFEYAEKIKKVVIEEGITAIGSYAFVNCTHITSVNMPSTVEYIGVGAFQECVRLSSVKIPESVTIIDNAVFKGCKSLTSITIPESVTILGGATFQGCTRLSSVTLSQSLTAIERSTFYDCTSLTTLVIPDGVKHIDTQAFSGCENLVDITLPNQLINIGPYVFQYCFALETVKIPEGVTTIQYLAFDGCSNLKSITLPTTLTDIGMGAFKDCYSLQDIYVKTATPPTFATTGNFQNSKDPDKVYNTATLYVPIGSLQAYKEATDWKGFANIQEFDPTAVSGIHDDRTISSPIYDLQGRKLQQKPSKGMYIQGGKKVLVK